MNSDSGETDDLVRQARGGDEGALAALFDRCRDRLRRMVRLRMDRRLAGRVDSDDVLQEAYLNVGRRFSEFLHDPDSMPIFLWMRLITGQTLVDIHRHHLGTQMRDAGREVSLYRGALPAATSVSLAAQLLGKMTSVSRAAIRAEHKLLVQEALNNMDPVDRDVLTLRHFEHLSNEETALVLGLKKSAASQRYIRALKRLKEILSSIPGLGDQVHQHFARGGRLADLEIADYRLLRDVGRGGMGVVYEAEQESLGRRVALKILPAGALMDPRRLGRFQREARSAAKLHHTKIVPVPVFGVVEHEGTHYYVMQ